MVGAKIAAVAVDAAADNNHNKLLVIANLSIN